MFKLKKDISQETPGKPIIITTCDPQGPYEVIEVVCGASVLASNVIKDTRESIRNLTGGDMKHYSDLLTASFDMAKLRLTEKAEALGADAVVTFRTQTVSLAEGAEEVICYGTAIRYHDDKN